MLYNLAIGRFPYGGIECSESVDWLLDASWVLSRDPRFNVCWLKENDTPITMTRNKMFADAKRMGADLLLIIDSDMAPDCEKGDPEAKPFLPTALDFVINHQGPCAIAAPYCGPPPHENIYVFHWTNLETGVPAGENGLKLNQFSREQAALMRGITEVAALPTGLLLMNVKGLDVLPSTHPYTYYDYAGVGPACPGCGRKERGPEAEKASTEDVTFTRDLSLAGVPVYCNWDAWAGHVKKKIVRKPHLFSVDTVAQQMREAILRGTRAGESLREVKSKRFAAEIAKAEAEYEAKIRLNGIQEREPQPVVEATPAEVQAVTNRIAQELNGEPKSKPVTMADLLRS